MTPLSCLRRVVVVLLLAASATGLGIRAEGAQSTLSEAQAKAGFLYNCAMFVEWPQAAFEGGDFVIGIIGADPVAGLISDMQGRKINGRSLRVKPARASDDPRGYQILFVGGDDPKWSSTLLTHASDSPTLTVGERGDFTARGGVVRLYTEQDRLRFEINMTSAERVGLKVSAKMLGLAKIVR